MSLLGTQFLRGSRDLLERLELLLGEIAQGRIAAVRRFVFEVVHCHVCVDVDRLSEIAVETLRVVRGDVPVLIAGARARLILECDIVLFSERSNEVACRSGVRGDLGGKRFRLRILRLAASQRRQRVVAEDVLLSGLNERLVVRTDCR